MFNTFFFRKSCRLTNNVEKYCRAGLATDNNTANALCMLGTKGYKHTLRICNTYYFPIATIVARTRLNVTLYIHCLSCSTLLTMYLLQVINCATASNTPHCAKFNVTHHAL